MARFRRDLPGEEGDLGPQVVVGRGAGGPQESAGENDGESAASAPLPE